jgi:putative DNA primase/helicase
VIPTDSPEALVSHLRTVAGLKVSLTHAGIIAVKPKYKLTAEIREAIDGVGIAKIQAALEAERRPVERLPGDMRPERPGKITDLMQDACATWAIVRAVNDPPRLFRRSGIAWIEPDDEGRPGAVHLDAARLTHYLSEIVLFTVERPIGDVVAKVPVPPPGVLVRDLLVKPDPPLPVLARIITAPVVTRTGAIHERPGYDPVSQAFYAPPPGFVVPPVPEEPNPAQVEGARELLLELVRDFPFVGPADLAHTLAAILTPFARDLIDGPTPLFLFNKPAPGTGASLLVGTIAQLVTGMPAETLSEAKDDEEWRKRLTAMLRPAPAVVVLDNLTGTLSSSALSTALTAIVWKDRVLGSNEEIKVLVRCVWLATGNNVKLITDLVRRTVAVSLDARVERPWLRARSGLEFRHPDLLAWVGRERAQLSMRR